MNDHELGAALRRRILGDRDGTLPTDGRRWQALVADLCVGEQSQLLPALRHLVSSAPFRRAVAESPPLGDPALAGALMAELGEVYAAPIVARLGAVVAGLFALPNMAAEPDRRPRRGPSGRPLGIQLLLALLAFGIGGLSAAIVAGLHRSLVPPGTAPGGASADLPPAAAPPVTPPVTPPRWRAPEEPLRRPDQASEAVEPGPGPDAEAAGRAEGQDASRPGAELDGEGEEASQQRAEERSIASVRRLYDALARQDGPRAGRLHSAEVADQFDPAFFARFASVGVTRLRVTGRRGERVFLEGVVTYVEADGSRQSETRSFVVDSGTRPARITASAFGEVIPGR